MIPGLENASFATNRLRLRPFAAADAETVFALFANWNVVRFLSAPPWPYVVDDATSWIAAVSAPASEDGESGFAITHAGELIGAIGARFRPPSHLQRGVGHNIGYWLGEPYWGHGYMTEAARGLIGLIFETFGCDMVFSGAFSENIASLRVQEKLGFVADGETTLLARPRNGTYPHTNTVLTRTRFEELNR